MGGEQLVVNICVGLLYLAAAIYIVYDPEPLAGFTGSLGRGNITAQTPPGMIRFAGCLMLSLPFGLLAWAVWWPLGIICWLGGAIALRYVANYLWPL